MSIAELPARRLALLALNLALAASFFLLAPVEPRLSDRNAYDYVGQAPFAPDCPVSIYCYRVLVPTVVHHLPLDPDTGWRAYQVLNNAAAGSVIAAVATTLSAAPVVPLLVSVMAQTSYGFTFTAYDPYRRRSARLPDRGTADVVHGCTIGHGPRSRSARLGSLRRKPWR